MAKGGIGEDPKEERIALMISAAELAAIDDYRFANRLRSRAEAIRHLCRLSLAGATLDGPGTADRKAKASSIRWEPHKDGSEWAMSGPAIVGFVTRTQDEDYAWTITDVTGSRHRPATGGHRASMADAKRALVASWDRWLLDRGLTVAGRPDGA